VAKTTSLFSGKKERKLVQKPSEKGESHTSPPIFGGREKKRKKNTGGRKRGERCGPRPKIGGGRGGFSLLL